MEPLALLLVAFGLPAAVWPYRFAKLDNVWHKYTTLQHVEEIEPSDGVVKLARAFGVFLILLGVVFTVIL